MRSPTSDRDTSVRPPDEFGGVTIFVLFLAALAAVAIPIVTHPLPPLSDYINHLASAHVVDVIDRDPDLSRYYMIEWQIVPNLMVDLIVPVLHRFMSIYLAGQIFMIMTFAGILSGTLALNRVLFGRWSAWPLVAAPLLYSGVLLVGVMNYLFGIGLALWALAAWVALRDRAWPWRIGVSTLFVLALFFCHLFALGLYGLELLAFELVRLWTVRNEPLGARLTGFVTTGVPFLPALVLLLVSPVWDSAGFPAFWEFWGKLDGLKLAVSIYEPIVAYGSIALLIVAVVLTFDAWRFHRVGWAILMVGGVIFLAMPRALFAAHLADQRLPIALAFMLAACIRPDFPDRRRRLGLLAVLALLIAARVTEVQLVWNALARGPVEALHSVPSIERGARVLVVHGDRSSTGLISDLGLLHIASLATIERSALVSTAFTVEGKHILQVRDAYRPYVDTADGTPPSIPYFLEAANGPGPYYFSDWPRHYDYVYLLFTRPDTPNPDPARLVPVFQGQHFQLYKVIKSD